MKPSYWINRAWVLAIILGLTGAACTTQATPDIRPPTPDPQPLTSNEPNAVTQARAQAAYGKLPLHFEPNQGQTNSQVKFLSRGSGYTLFLTSTEAVLALHQTEPKAKGKGQKAKGKREEQEKTVGTILHMQLVGTNPNPQVEGLEELPGKSNYFIGNDPKKWRTNIPTYARVQYKDIYPGIDLVYYGNQRQLEHDFTVAPGADPKAIRLAFVGLVGAGLVPAQEGRPQGSPLQIDDNGDLILQTAGGEVRLQKPRIYQEIDGVKQPIPGGYVLLEPETRNSKLETQKVGFQLAAYDTSKPLIIDPVLFYSTYYGGNDDDISDTSQAPAATLSLPGTSVSGSGIAVDSSGNAYVTGLTLSTNLFTSGVFDMTCGTDGTCNGGKYDAFVAKLNSTGSALLYSTYLGGSDNDIGDGIAVDADGNAYVTGQTISSDFPTPNAFDADCGTDGDGICGDIDQVTNEILPDAFVARLNNTGNMLDYSTYLGGQLEDVGLGIAVNASGNAYVTGRTDSPSSTFPTVNPINPIQPCHPSFNAFVTKLNFNTNTSVLSLDYSTCLGGNNFDEGQGIAVDSLNKVYVTGVTGSTDLSKPGAFDPTCGTDGLCNPDAGGFPTADAFVTKLDPELADTNQVLYSTYLGGSGIDLGFGIAVDADNNAYVTGGTNSSNFPDPTNTGTASKKGTGAPGASFDAFVVKLNNTGSSPLLYSTYLGSSNDDLGFGIAVDSFGNAYVTGGTASTLAVFDFPVENPLQPGDDPGAAGDLDAFVTKVNTTGSALTYSTYLGGSKFDAGLGIAADACGNAYVTGETQSNTDFLLTNALQPTFGGGTSDGFVTKIGHAPFAYISNHLELPNGTVSVIDTGTKTADADPIQVGVNPHGVAVHPDGTRVYVTNQDTTDFINNDTVSVINTTTNTVIATVSVGVHPTGVAVHPSGELVYVANSILSPNATTHTISVIRTSTNTIVETIPLTLVTQANVPIGVAVNPKGDKVYVTNQVGNQQGQEFVTVIKVNSITPSSHSFDTTVPVGVPDLIAPILNAPQGVAVSPDNTRVYVANGGSDTVSVIDTGSNTEIAIIQVGNSPFGMAVHPKGDKVYVTNGFPDNTVSVIDTDPNSPTFHQVIATVPVGNGPRGVAVTPDEAFVYVANFHDDTVSVLDIANNHNRIDFDPTTAGTQDLPVGDGPIAFGQFIGPLDQDGDGIADSVDGSLDVNNNFNDENTFCSNNFADKDLVVPSEGSIIDRDDLIVSVWEALDPAGLFVRATGGAGTANVDACGIPLNLTEADGAQLICGSLTLQVFTGPIEIPLGDGTFVSVPSGGIVKVTESNGQFTIENQGSTEITIVDSQGNETPIAPGSSSTFPPATDSCPDDPNKTDPGICGCGVADTDSDNDGTADCNDTCPSDPNKTAPGACGCGVADTDSDSDGTADCNDGCPNDPAKIAPGVCGCGVVDTDSDGDSISDCNDGCSADPNKTAPGVCGCGVPDTDSDGDSTPDCNDTCPTVSGTGPDGCPVVTPPTDSDGDGLPDNEDTCPNSDLSETVVIEGCDTGVANDLSANGCTISDLVAGCAEGATNHGQYVDCVAQLTNDLKEAGTITGKEKGAIQSCAAQANIP